MITDEEQQELLALVQNQTNKQGGLEYNPQNNRYKLAYKKPVNNVVEYKGKKYLKLKPVMPSLQLANRLSRELSALVQSMLQDVIKSVLALYNKNDERISYTADSEPKENLARKIEVLIGDRVAWWQPLFNKFSLTFNKNVVTNVNDQLKYNLKQIETVMQDWHVPFTKENARALTVKEAVIRDNVNLIRKIPARQQEIIFDKVMEGMTRGRDVKWLKEELHYKQNIEIRRSERIARDQLRKATSAMNTAQQLDCGITHNIWRHSHMDKVPRKTHLEADGKVFDLSEGCYIDGEYIQPAEKINCTCYSIPVIEIKN